MEEGSEIENAEQGGGEPEFGEGIIEISGKGFGFLRDPKRNFVQTPQDIFVTPEIVRRFGLRDGMWINGETRRGNRGPQLTKLTTINGEDPDQIHESSSVRRTNHNQSEQADQTRNRPGSLYHAHHGLDDAARNGPARLDRSTPAHR